MRAVTYHRVSTFDQNPELAQHELDAWVTRAGGIIVERITESASGAWNGRPGLQRVLELVRKGEVDAVVVWKLDRFGRSTVDLHNNIQKLRDAAVRFVATSQGIDVKAEGDAVTNLIVTVLAGVAEFERTIIRERTMLGLERARRSGKKLGRPKARGPLPEDVVAARQAGKSWSTIASEFRCTINVARARAAEVTNEGGEA